MTDIKECEYSQQVKVIKRKRKSYRPKRSRLYKHKADIVCLRKAGASYEDISLWLRKNKRIKITSRNINYFYNKHCMDKNEKS